MTFTLGAAAWMLATSTVLPVAVDRSVSWPPPQRGVSWPDEQKAAAMRPLISSATDCIARTVSADPQLQFAKGDAGFNDLIVASVPSCTDALRSMIDAYDRLYGEGAGETFFTGPYLDALPEAVTQRVRVSR